MNGITNSNIQSMNLYTFPNEIHNPIGTVADNIREEAIQDVISGINFSEQGKQTEEIGKNLQKTGKSEVKNGSSLKHKGEVEVRKGERKSQSALKDISAGYAQQDKGLGKIQKGIDNLQESIKKHDVADGIKSSGIEKFETGRDINKAGEQLQKEGLLFIQEGFYQDTLADAKKERGINTFGKQLGKTSTIQNEQEEIISVLCI